MLPFLKRKNEASVSNPPESLTRKADEPEEYDPLDSASEDLIEAVHSKNVKRVTEALSAAFDLRETQPHDEYPHGED